MRLEEIPIVLDERMPPNEIRAVSFDQEGNVLSKVRIVNIGIDRELARREERES